MAFADAAETGESVEEMVVAAKAGSRHESTHRESVDQIVVELLIFERIGRRYLAGRTGGRIVLGARVHIRRSTNGRGIKAHVVFRSVANPGFGIDCAVQMIVQV